jgi:uncharacterized RDD family membrane protein YckC
MSQPLPGFDLLRMAGLRKKKDGRERYATFNHRMLASSIDYMLMAVPLIYAVNYIFPPVAFNMPALKKQIETDPAAGWGTLIHAMNNAGVFSHWLISFGLQSLVIGLLTGWFWHRWAATPGKMLLRLRVVDATTELPISDRQILLRLLGYLLSFGFLCLGFIWIGLDKKRQGWHDKIAHTVVIRTRFLSAKSPSAIVDPSDSPEPSAAE